MLEALQKLIIAAYGERAQDGKVFRKNPEITEDFKYSAAFAQLMDDIMYKGDVETVKNFMLNIFPSKFAGVLTEEIAKAQLGGDGFNVEKVTGEVVG
jgi:hypothetical protein